MAQSRPTPDSPISTLLFELYAAAMPAAGVPDSQLTAIMGALSATSRGFHAFFNAELKLRAIVTQLWRAVIDGNQKAVVHLFNELNFQKPKVLLRLLTQPAPKGLVITSQLSFQKFDLGDETLLSAAAKRNQIKMIATLLSCCKQLPQTDALRNAIKEALSKWKFQTINLQGREDIDIPQEYLDYANTLIDAFKAETLILPERSFELDPSRSPLFGLIEDGKLPFVVREAREIVQKAMPPSIESVKEKLSEQTESVLSSLFNKLFPLDAVKLDNYCNVELLLLALYQQCRIGRGNHMGYDFGDFSLPLTRAFCIRVIGLAQSALTRENAIFFLKDNESQLFDVVKQIRNHFQGCTYNVELTSGQAFFRSLRDLQLGLGYQFLFSRCLVEQPVEVVTGNNMEMERFNFAYHLIERQKAFRRICQVFELGQEPPEPAQSGCKIS